MSRSCTLPKILQSFCESGCIYRAATHRHLACNYNFKANLCVAPCQVTPCSCKPKNGRDINQVERPYEVSLLQEEDRPRIVSVCVRGKSLC